jgi:Trm5-related predicted tRNA methylase
MRISPPKPTLVVDCPDWQEHQKEGDGVENGWKVDMKTGFVVLN